MIRKPPLGPDWSPVSAWLLEFASLAPPEPSETPHARPKPLEPPCKRRGRRSNDRVGPHWKAVAEILSKNKTLRSGSSIARALKMRPEYAAMSERTLRRCAKNVFDRGIDILKKIPADLWKERLGISPPPQGAMTEKVFREKAIELLRYDLRQHELLAKKQ
jgi:hypothetical protein